MALGGYKIRRTDDGENGGKDSAAGANGGAGKRGKASVAGASAAGKSSGGLDRHQSVSLAALLVMVVLVVGFSYDVGLVCLTLSLILMLLGAADEKKAIKMIPWNVLILISGVNVLMNITQKMGGIDLLSDILASFMSARTAAPLMGVTGGIMSWFSSANGVVFPTLIPAVPDIAGPGGRCVRFADGGGNRVQRHGGGNQPAVHRRQPDYGQLYPGDGLRRQDPAETFRTVVWPVGSGGVHCVCSDAGRRSGIFGIKEAFL